MMRQFGGHMMNGYGGFDGGGFWFMGLVPMILQLILVVVIVVAAVKLFQKYMKSSEVTRSKEDAAMAVLRERYARGEIDADEFQRRKADLM